MLDNIQEIEISELRKLTQVVNENYGFDFKDYAMSSFRRRVQRIVELYKFKSVGTLIDKLETTPSFFEEFLSEITVNVTEMFRDPTFWTLLREDILPELANKAERLNIWHAGCSSGEEVYSMAITLRELGLLEKSNLIATDIDTVIIDKAKEGLVHKKHMELNEQNYKQSGGEEDLKKYFMEDKNGFHFLPEFTEHISFRKHNLVDGNVFSKFDLVLCRNVMIYFNQTLQNEVLKKLHGSLFNYGHLAIGSKESLIWCDIANKFAVVNNEEKIYKKIKE